MPHASGAMVSRPLCAPFLDKPPRADREAVAAVGIADLEDGTRHGLRFRHHQLETALGGLGHGEQCHRAMLHRHLYRQAAAHFAVERAERPDLGLAVGDRHVAGTVVPHQDHIVLEVRRVEFGERSAGAEVQALRQPQPGKVAIELLLEAPNGTFAPKVFFVTILQPPRITGPATNMIRSTGERTQPIHFAVTGSSPPLSFEGGFGPELLRKYDLQWKINNPAGTNLAITLTVKPPQDFQGTETFTAIAGDAAGQQVTNEFIFQFALRENIWVNSIGMTLAWVANLPGCENSQWMNRANGGWVGRCEVTQDEFTQVLHTNPSKSRAAGNGKFPVESMSVEEATRFCEELTRLDGRLLPAGWHYALPTEEQWEFFAAGTPAMDTKFAYFAPARIKKPTMPQEVGRLATNAFGLYDVLGNVAELTSTLWHYTTNADEMKLYICRGGGFHSTSTQITPNREDVVDKASWHFYGPAYDIGFRVILIPR